MSAHTGLSDNYDVGATTLYCVKLMSNEVNPDYSPVFQSDIEATYEARKKATKPLGYTVMKTPPWTLVVPTVCCTLCKYRKSGTDLVLYRSYYSELMDLMMAIKQLRRLAAHISSSQNVYLTMRQLLLLN